MWKPRKLPMNFTLEVVKQGGVFVCENELFTEQITSFDEKKVTINAMQRSLMEMARTP